MTIRPCKFYIMNPATGDAACLDRHGFIERWDTTMRWDHARRFDTKADGAMALFLISQIDRSAMSYRIVTEI